jgi:hypothetical protein
VHPFFDEEIKTEIEYTADEYVLRIAGYMDNNGSAAATAIIYKNQFAIWTKCMNVNVRTDPVEVLYHSLIVGLNHLLSMNVKQARIEGDDFQIIENMEEGLLYHVNRVMKLHLYAEELTKMFDEIEYEIISPNDNKRGKMICRNAVIGIKN